LVFWLIGFLKGVSKIKKDDFYLQFLLFVVLYFICASIGGILFGVSSRFRVPLMPFIAILSANGWLRLAKRREGVVKAAKKLYNARYLFKKID
jgi:hypothetical protein